MANRDLLTIAEAADKLNLSGQRVHQLIASGDLDGVDLPAGRARHVPGAPRVFAHSVDRLRRRRAEAAQQKAAARSGADVDAEGKPRLARQGSAQRRPDGELEAARAAAWEMKVRLDVAREHLRAERVRTKRALDVAANLIDLLRESEGAGERLDALADGYSDAMTHLLAPDEPPHE